MMAQGYKVQFSHSKLGLIWHIQDQKQNTSTTDFSLKLLIPSYINDGSSHNRTKYQKPIKTHLCKKPKPITKSITTS